MSEWQPIDTAPRDGRRVLAWDKDEGRYVAEWLYDHGWVAVPVSPKRVSPLLWQALPALPTLTLAALTTSPST